MSVSFICPICRQGPAAKTNTEEARPARSWPLRKRRNTMRCSNPACDGRFVMEPFPIIHASPGVAFERMIHVPSNIPLDALGMMLRSLPPGSQLRRSFEDQSSDLWAHFHDLLPEEYRPDFVHPAPFALRAMSILDQAPIPDGARALVVGSGPGRAALEMALRLKKRADQEMGKAREDDSTMAHFYPEVFAMDLDPMQMMTLRMLSKHPLEVLLRGSAESWHSPERLELPNALRKVSDLVHPLCADALDPPFADESFDLILCLDLLERVASPMKMLVHMQRLLRPNGLLLISSAFTWRDEVTPPEERLAALVPHARRPDYELLQDILSGRLKTGVPFDLYSVAVMQPMPRVVRLYDTEYRVGLSHVALWGRASLAMARSGAHRPLSAP